MTSIWEQMILEERKAKAVALGIKISDLEEQEALDNAIEANITVNTQHSDHNIPSTNDEPINLVDQEDLIIKRDNISQETEICFEDEPDEFFQLNNNAVKEQIRIPKKDKDNKVMEGPWYYLPDVLVDLILIFVGDPDTIGHLLMTCKSTFQPSEVVYKRICEFIYPMQTSKKLLRVDKWGTWKNMMIHRPRLRMNGFYTIRTKYTKAPNNDAFWEEKKYHFIEVKFYRHMRFFEDGRVLYSLDTLEPDDMAKILELGVSIPKRVYEGHYTLTRRDVVVEVPMHYCIMRFELLLHDADDGFVGKHNMLKLISHSSIPSNSRWNNERVYFSLPVFADLRFHRNWKFDHRQRADKWRSI